MKNVIVATLLLFGLLIVVGCANNRATTKPTDSYDRQNAAMRDPFDYKPDMNEQDISGGDLGHLDRGAMRRDVDHVLNP